MPWFKFWGKTDTTEKGTVETQLERKLPRFTGRLLWRKYKQIVEDHLERVPEDIDEQQSVPRYRIKECLSDGQARLLLELHAFLYPKEQVITCSG